MISINDASENSIIVYFGSETSDSISNQINAFCIHMKTNYQTYIIDLISSYASVLLIFDVPNISHSEIKRIVRASLAKLEKSSKKSGVSEEKQVITLPVLYGGENGPDLSTIAKNAGISEREVISIHESKPYLVYAIGFAPGFAYLGEVDPKIASPRLETPRQMVPKGAVAIADRQTAVYPAESPGGWNIIGICPIPMFNSLSPPYMPVSVGDTVKFESIDENQFDKIQEKLLK
ncbi:MAG: 5-oxoprolinase subunit PxpB [Pseudomonadota bacterium]|jgi:KipI family sensor histidine kinase inhibitor|nr:allophanate hydrolase [Porticoccaceae bacterium]MEC7158403.1 5-oxoprolinase subunit PxpB [Pseudomonadota bacterium]MEC8212836.1 5-oxoprolinase subunit PxpB [Pseudomonadota bacterium]MEC8470552.1 5-oxoprolinase subunit PxpB [Pseudomonadota bacterium]MEC8498638.1 5-oxoprolinase subunit PxpB [Pseudomonadota bacterium]|tara:strand:- start:14778 stop:15479 length:702 start_codon:yes stop_codon:yes gene_type:complete